MLSLSDDYLVYTVSSEDKELRVTEKAVSSPWFNCGFPVICVQTTPGTHPTEK